ncbi:MAG: tetratricopeptide repeat protein [Desulfovibrio sp.]|uniref:tetratricopeptide repeat protein n=1 Tax=Desulfovibrio sp. 7SRBS1 TaxID=3378064 RepID=UPI003B3EDF71
MGDVVWLQIIQSIFWLLIVIGIIWGFRKELKNLLESLGRVEVAGAAFQFGDKKDTLRSYMLLSGTLVDVLSQTERIEHLAKLLTSVQVEYLGQFALKYTKELPQSEWNEELLKNIAFLLLRFGRYPQAVHICDILLKERPDNLELLNIRGLALMTSRSDGPILQARELFKKLVSRYPELPYIRFNYSLALSLAGDIDMSLREMERVINDGYWKEKGDLLSDPLFLPVKEKKPDEVIELSGYINKLKEKYFSEMSGSV